jgi:hypothetical protein
MTHSERPEMDNVARVSLGSRIRPVASTASRALWPYSRTALLWLVAIELAPVVYVLYAIARGAGVLHRREAGIAKGFVRAATFFAAALVAICTVVGKCAETAGRWLSKKVGLPYPKKAEAVNRGEDP